MNRICKGLAFSLSVIFLFTLCLTPAVFATEGDNSHVNGVSATPPQDSGTPPASPSDGTQQPEQPQEPELPDNETPPPPEQESQTATASTADELLDWLLENEDVGGTLTLTGDIFLCDVSYISDWGAMPVTIDTGEFSISASGSVEIISNMLTIRGKGGEKGVLRASEGGKLALSYLTVTADEGYAVFQEEDAGFAADECTITGNIRYADAPFAWEWKQGLAVVKPGGLAADSLPDTLEVQVNRNGSTGSYESTPVTWDLEGHEDAQADRLRFTIAGVFEGMVSLISPSCTVVYDDYPLTFLLVSGKKLPGGRGENYQFKGKFSVPEDRLPIIVAQEYSFDGETWLLCEEKDFPSSHISFNMMIPGREWDTERDPAIFLRMRWDDAGTMCYSNVLGFAADNLAEGEDHGGNRGGGTDITDPPTVPAPDPPEDGNGSGDGNGLPNPTPDPDPTPEPPGNGGGSVTPDPTPTPKPPVSPDSTPDSTPAPTPNPTPPPVSEPTPPPVSEPTPNQPPDSAEVSAAPEAPPPTQGKPVEVTPAPDPTSTPEPPATADSMESSTSFESEEVLAIPEPASTPKGPGVLPIAVGCATVASSIGAAGFCLHPRALKRLLELLRNILPKK